MCAPVFYRKTAVADIIRPFLIGQGFLSLSHGKAATAPSSEGACPPGCLIIPLPSPSVTPSPLGRRGGTVKTVLYRKAVVS